MPALLTSPSRPPKALTPKATVRSMSARFDMSQTLCRQPKKLMRPTVKDRAIGVAHEHLPWRHVQRMRAQFSAQCPMPPAVTSTRWRHTPLLYRHTTPALLEGPWCGVINSHDRLQKLSRPWTYFAVGLCRLACPGLVDIASTQGGFGENHRYGAFLRSTTVPSSLTSTIIIDPSGIGLVFTSIRSKGNTFSPSGVQSLISCFVRPA
jgi:hypothetical protein